MQQQQHTTTHQQQRLQTAEEVPRHPPRQQPPPLLLPTATPTARPIRGQHPAPLVPMRSLRPPPPPRPPPRHCCVAFGCPRGRGAVWCGSPRRCCLCSATTWMWRCCSCWGSRTGNSRCTPWYCLSRQRGRGWGTLALLPDLSLRAWSQAGLTALAQHKRPGRRFQPRECRCMASTPPGSGAATETAATVLAEVAVELVQDCCWGRRSRDVECLCWAMVCLDPPHHGLQLLRMATSARCDAIVAGAMWCAGIRRRRQGDKCVGTGKAGS